MIKKIIIFISLAALFSCSTKSKVMSNNIEYIIVFKKEVPLSDAELIMKKSELAFTAGSDSSKGKVYFYSTGPKFRIESTQDNQEKILNYFKSQNQIFEVYEANWNITKD